MSNPYLDGIESPAMRAIRSQEQKDFDSLVSATIVIFSVMATALIMLGFMVINGCPR